MYNLLDCFKAQKKLLGQNSSWGGNTQTKNTLLRLNLCHCGIYESPGFSQSQGHGLSSQAITPWALATQACVSSGKQRAPPTNAATTAAAFAAAVVAHGEGEGRQARRQRQDLYKMHFACVCVCVFARA